MHLHGDASTDLQPSLSASGASGDGCCDDPGHANGLSMSADSLLIRDVRLCGKLVDAPQLLHHLQINRSHQLLDHEAGS